VWKPRVGEGKNIKIWNTRFSNKKTGYEADIHGFKCIQIRLDNKLYRAHRLAWAYIYGEWPSSEIDHKNMNPCDNRIENLRLASRSQNECNKSARADNKLGVKGVYYDQTREKYMVQLKKGDVRIKKRVESLAEAKSLYNDLSKKHHGEFGRAI
jgi:hypothetical protein